MKRFLFIALIILLSTQVMAANVAREIPGAANPGDTISISIILTETPVDEVIVVGELLPEGAALGRWSIAAADQNSISFTEEGNSVIWEFTAAASQVVITYDIILPEQAGDVVFDAVYAMPPDTFGNDKAVLPVRVGGQVQVIPTLESPAPEPTFIPTRGLGPLFLLLIFVMIFVAMLWYFTSRFDQVHSQKNTVAVTEAIGEKFYDVVVKKRVAERMDLPEGFETVPPKIEHTLQHFEEEKQEMVDTINSMEMELPHIEQEKRSELEHLKREIIGIRFAQKDV